MKIAILGNGGREHAIADQITKSPKLTKLYCLPGNAGTKFIAENVNKLKARYPGGEFNVHYSENRKQGDL